jgi:hypothetical protein
MAGKKSGCQPEEKMREIGGRIMLGFLCRIWRSIFLNLDDWRSKIKEAKARFGLLKIKRKKDGGIGRSCNWGLSFESCESTAVISGDVLLSLT